MNQLELPYILVKPVKTKDSLRFALEGEEAGPDSWILIENVQDAAEELRDIWEGHEASGEPYLVIDLETRGTQAHDLDNCYPVLLGIYSPVRGGVAVDLRSPSGPGAFAIISQKLAEWKVPLVAFNATFDGAFLSRAAPGMDHNWLTDVYVLFRLICGEGFDGQRWGLKPAQASLLGWDSRGDVELDEWLVANGHAKQNGSPRKEDMYLAPAEILGKYCVLDCYSTHLLLAEVLQPVIDKFPILYDYSDWFNSIIKNVIRQQLRGLMVDRDRMAEYIQQLSVELKEALHLFMNCDIVAPHIETYNKFVREEFLKTEPVQYKKPPNEPKEPAKFKQNGEVSKSWLGWKQRHEEWLAYKPEETKHWKLWQEKKTKVLSENHFNTGSDNDIRWLFYDCLNYPVVVETAKGNAGASKDALLGFGKAGILLYNVNAIETQLRYVQKALNSARLNKDGTWTIHPQFKVPGTFTCRLSGDGGLNLQQVPKTNGYLSCYVARPGMRLVDIDYSGLEDYVLAELSRDKAMLDLYGPDAPTCQDGYIYVAAKLGAFGKPFLDMGYVPDKPTKEAVGRCKKELKGLRNIAKSLKLGKNYGAGSKKIHQSLTIKGVDISFNEVQTLCKAFDKLFAGNVAYGDWIRRILDSTGGWCLDGLGGPVCVDASYRKDAVNRIVQRSGHLILAHYIHELTQELDRRGLIWEPWIIDFHDEVILEVPEDQVAAVRQCMVDVIASQREFLGGVVKLKASPDEGACLAPFKVEDFSSWLEQQPIELQRQLK